MGKVVDVTDVIAGLLARNLGPDRFSPDANQQPDYGVVATLNEALLEVVLTFRCGASYCCAEWECHLTLPDGKRWDALREALAARGGDEPDRLNLRLSCVIEEGAVFFDFLRPDPTRRNWYAFEPAAAQRYDVSAVEAGIA